MKAQYAAAAPLIVAGHSSGGYGALMLAMQRQKTFGAVVALSPDSDFETTHKPLAQAEEVRAVTPAQLAAATAPAARCPECAGARRARDGMCANYTPLAGEPGKFEWLYGPGGAWRPAVWARWIACDPLTVVREQERRVRPGAAHLPGRRASWMNIGANVGARKIAAILRERGAKVEFQQPAGHHGENLPERLARGVAWVLEGTP